MDSPSTCCVFVTLYFLIIALRLLIFSFCLYARDCRLTGFEGLTPIQSFCVKSLFLFASRSWISTSVSGALRLELRKSTLWSVSRPVHQKVKMDLSSTITLLSLGWSLWVDQMVGDTSAGWFTWRCSTPAYRGPLVLSCRYMLTL